MNMFKTIGMIVGGAAVGAVATMALKDRENLLETIENKVKEKVGESIQHVGEKVAEPDNAGNEGKEDKELKPQEKSVAEKEDINKDEILKKLDNMENLIKEVRDLLKEKEGKTINNEQPEASEGSVESVSQIDVETIHEAVSEAVKEAVEAVSHKDESK